MADPTPVDPHEAYLARCTAEARARLLQVRQVVEGRVAGAAPCIAYQMPAFRRGRVFFYMAAFKQHIGVYPPVTVDEALVQETAPFRGPKGNLAFPHRQPLPLDLIGRVAEALAAQYATAAPAPRARR